MVAILLATYNGAHYLNEQIDSIIAQTFTEWNLYIHDDGSNDETLQIIKHYVIKYSQRIFFIEDSQTHRGAAQSFFYLLNKVTAEFYMFCDQDDVWFPNKIEESMRVMQHLSVRHANTSLLVCSDLNVVDSNLQLISSSMWSYCGIRTYVTQNHIKYSPIVTGCTMLINQKTKEEVAPYIALPYLHDIIISLVVSKNGHIEFINKPLILYRQHQSNVLGAHKSTSSLLNKIKNINSIMSDLMSYFAVSHVITHVSLLDYILKHIQVFIQSYSLRVINSWKF